MSGGIYVNKKFSPNIKCLIFAFTMLGLYWLTSRFSEKKPNFLLFPLIFSVAYVSMAWYDVAYNCSDKLLSGNVGLASVFDSIFKKQLREQQHKDSVLDQEHIYQRNVYLFHLLFIVPILSWVGIQGYRGKIVGKDWFTVLIVVALSAFVYHAYRFFTPRQTCNIIVDKEGNIKAINKGNLPKPQ
jgi:hypothetical protein